jgi:predicted lipoprotein with Yx(FWY)xxD motif
MRIRFFSPLLLAALVAAGCGSSSSKSSSSSAPASAPTASTSSTASAAPTAAPVTITTKHNKLGTILAAGPKRFSVYLFEADTSGASTCSGACAALWPPVVGKPSASGGAHTSALGTITRADGTVQVTYKGHPLYYYAKDKDSGDAYGAGIKSYGAKWYTLAPTGNKIDNA